MGDKLNKKVQNEKGEGVKNMGKKEKEEVVVSKEKEIKSLLKQLGEEKSSNTGAARAIRRKLRSLGYFLSKKNSKSDEDEDGEENPKKTKKVEKSKKARDDDEEDEEDEDEDE